MSERGGQKPLTACSAYSFGEHLAQSFVMKPSESFLAHRDALREIIARHGVTRPRVFGSAARGACRGGLATGS